ncbi:DNA repair protein RecN [Gemmatimonadota bacterium]
MLHSLHVHEFAVIEDAELLLSPSLTILTGETGAGKSVLIGALQLLLGDRSSSDQVRSGASRASLEATLSIPAEHPVRSILHERGIPLEEDMLIIRRDVGRQGRSRAFMNDIAVTVAVLREVGQELIDLHGQHEHQSLLRPSNHLLLLDAFAGLDSERERYAALLEEFQTVRRQLEAIRRQVSEREEWRELHQFQLSEIDAVDPQEDEEEALGREVQVLDGAEKIMGDLSHFVSSLSDGESPLIDQLQQHQGNLEGLSRIDDSLADTTKLVEDALLSLTESIHAAQRYLDGFEYDQERLEAARDRLTALIQLAKKYGGSYRAMLTRREELRDILREQTLQVEETAELAERAGELRDQIAEKAWALHKQRASVVEDLQIRVEAELKHLAMPGARFQIAIELREDSEGLIELPDGIRCDTGPNGIDRVEFRLQTNPGSSVLPLQKIASGGEVSRIMLALKSVFGKASHILTLVFDEIDSGIGGATADRVGDRLEGLATERQVVVITHLPQIARRGSHHLLVEKSVEQGVTRARIHHLEGEERTRALAVLMSGNAESESVLEHARKLLQEPERVDGIS